MTHLSLFSGIGGLDLAAEMAGVKTVGQCEWADFPTKVLEKHWPDVPRWRDIRTLTEESFFEKTGMRTVDVISGGFPCQPFSVAGKQEGKADDRYLWPEMRRVLSELTPRWVVGENVPGILRIAAADVVQDLESLGYDVVLFDIEAASVGAPHHRERIAFVANRVRDRSSARIADPKSRQEGDAAEFKHSCADVADDNSIRELSDAEGRNETGDRFSNGSTNVADANSGNLRHDGENERAPYRKEYTSVHTSDAGREKIVSDAQSWRIEVEFPEWTKARGSGGCRRWPAEPIVGRVAYGIPDRVDRLKCLGNAVCPHQFYPIFKGIVEWEEKWKSP